MKQRILYYQRSGKNYTEIVCCPSEEGHKATKVGVYKYLRRYEETRTISRTPGSGQASKMTTNAKQIIKDQMCKDDETTECELQKLLSKDDIHVSARKALRWQKRLDIKRYQLLPDDQGCQQRKNIGVGDSKQRHVLRRCHFFQLNLLSKLKLTRGPAAVKEGKSPDTSQSRNILSKYKFGQGSVIEGAQICAYLRGR